MTLPKRHWSPEQKVVDTKLFGLHCHGEPKWPGADYEKGGVHDLGYSPGGIGLESRTLTSEMALPVKGANEKSPEDQPAHRRDKPVHDTAPATRVVVIA
jgi:hypothetical protein